MTKAELIKRQEDYYNDVCTWFINELAKWSKKHNMYIEDYSILRMWVIGSDDGYEPYQRYNTEGFEEQFAEALKDYEEIADSRNELGVDCYQGMSYTEEHKFIQ